MEPLDNPQLMSPVLAHASDRLLRPDEKSQLERMNTEERFQHLRDLLEKPIHSFTMMNELYFRYKWESAFSLCSKSAKDAYTPLVLEVASGDADMIPQMMARVYPGSRYVTANMNKELTKSLMSRTAGLPLDIRVFEGDAADLIGFIEEGTVDIIAFQHAVNDVLQAILCDREGIDTTHTDWMKILPDMIRLLRMEMAMGTFEQSVRAAFTNLLTMLVRLLRPGGRILMSHYQFQLDLDWGYPPDLFLNMIPMIRDWVRDIPGMHEVRHPDFCPQWWLMLERVPVPDTHGA